MEAEEGQSCDRPSVSQNKLDSVAFLHGFQQPICDVEVALQETNCITKDAVIIHKIQNNEVFIDVSAALLSSSSQTVSPWSSGYSSCKQSVTCMPEKQSVDATNPAEEPSIQNFMYQTSQSLGSLLEDSRSANEASSKQSSSSISSPQKCTREEQPFYMRLLCVCVPEEVPTQNTSRKSAVQFSEELTIREYPIIVGDNPAVTKGVPLTIDWEHVSSHSIPLAEYETRRQNKHRPPTRLAVSQRETILRNLGFSDYEIQEGQKAAKIGRTLRRITVFSLDKSFQREQMEALVQKMVNAMGPAIVKRAEQDYLERHTPNYNPAA